MKNPIANGYYPQHAKWCGKPHHSEDHGVFVLVFIIGLIITMVVGA